ncbi:MAG: redoxin domain-containing protein [Bacteroidota bacterium]
MKKTYLLMACLLLITAVFSVSALGTTEIVLHSPHKAPLRLPDLPMTTTKGTQINAQSLEGKVVLILFQPDCDHCQREAEDIHEHLDAFGEYSIYFVANAPIKDIQKFARDYRLNEQANIFFAYAELQPILDNFISIPTPSLYIYSNQQLVKAFEGETPIEKILEHL